MAYCPFPFLTALPLNFSAIAHISELKLFADPMQQLIVAQANFSVTAYQPTDFCQLGCDFPYSLQNAVTKRQAEYLAGRYLSQLTMQQSGLFSPTPPQLGVAAMRSPDWPQAVIGSISHHQQSVCVALLTQPLGLNSFVGLDTELWLKSPQASDIASSIHQADEQQMLLEIGFTPAQATTLIFSAKEALFKAICPFVGQYFGFDAALLVGCVELTKTTTTTNRYGWLHLALTSDWVLAKAPQQKYRCWFSCNAEDVITLICSDAVCCDWDVPLALNPAINLAQKSVKI